jgi:peptidoglycan/LPS O-acetylase OafA/YrhL
MLSFRAYSGLSIKESLPFTKNKVVYFSTTIILFFFFIGIKFLTITLSNYINPNYARLLIYLLWIFIIPVLFHFFKTSEVDRFTGELSYPVYLIHIVVIAITKSILDTFDLSKGLLGIVSMVITLLWSAIFYIFIIKRLDEKRNKIVSRQI